MGTEHHIIRVELEPELQVTVSVLIYRAIQGKVGNEVQFLMARRKKMPEKGRLSPPGGKVESGESPEAAAVIEMWEEDGMKISFRDLKRIYEGKQEFTVSGYTFEHHIGFLVRWEERMGEPEDREPDTHEEWEWIAEHDLEIHQATDQLSLIAATLLKSYREIGQTGKTLKEDVTVGRLLSFV